MGKLTEEDKLMRRIEKRFNKGVMQYGLIEDGDKILVGLSGGKDSLALLELLARRSRIYKPRFSVVAAHVVMTNIAYESDMEYLRAYAEGLGVCALRNVFRSVDRHPQVAVLSLFLEPSEGALYGSQGARMQQDSLGTSHG